MVAQNLKITDLLLALCDGIFSTRNGKPTVRTMVIVFPIKCRETFLCSDVVKWKDNYKALHGWVKGIESFKADVNYHDCMALCVLQLMEV
jgi:hypothetical protein